MHSILNSTKEREIEITNTTVPFFLNTHKLSDSVLNYILSLEKMMNPQYEIPISDQMKTNLVYENEIKQQLDQITQGNPNINLNKNIKSILDVFFKNKEKLKANITVNFPQAEEDFNVNKKKIEKVLNDIKMNIKKHYMYSVIHEEKFDHVALQKIEEKINHIRENILTVSLISGKKDAKYIKHLYLMKIREISRIIPDISHINLKREIASKIAFLLDQANNNNGVFYDIKRLEKIRHANRKIIFDYKKKYSELNKLLTQLIENARYKMYNDMDNLNKQTNENINILYFVIIVSLLSSLSIIYFYVNPRIIFRLKKLSSNIQKIAYGNYQTEIDLSGNDEISDMSKSLDILKSGLIKKKKIEKERQELIESLIKSNDELERFAYVSSHDLQEPIRMMKSFSEILDNKYKDKLDERGLKYLNIIIDSAKRMQNIIGDLLDYSRLTHEVDHTEKVNLNNTLEYVLINLQEAIEQSQADITYDNLPVINTNSLRVTRVFQNLISNALKYQPENQKPVIHISCEEREKEWLFCVSDNGIGIKKEYIDQIFIIFKRLHNKNEYSGNGIGLGICNKIIENMGGKIWVESEYGKGSQFLFTIPRNIIPMNVEEMGRDEESHKD